MSEGPQGSGAGRAAFRYRSAEIAVALLFGALGGVVIHDSLRLGAKWASDGPQAGYFPFYIGVILCVSAAMILLRALTIRPEHNRAFVEVGQLKLVLTLLVPSAIYVALIAWIGIYVASILFVGFFMRRLGRYAWWMAGAVSAGNSVVFFFVFEVWFRIPLPKGPLEALLGLN